MNQIKQVTWSELTKIEPRLITLLADVKAVRDPGSASFCANEIWYDQFRERVSNLAGWCAENRDPRIASSAAYDIVYQTLYELLPPCRNCMCL